MKNRKYYERLFAEYTDVVTVTEFCAMLGRFAKKRTEINKGESY